MCARAPRSAGSPPSLRAHRLNLRASYRAAWLVLLLATALRSEACVRDRCVARGLAMRALPPAGLVAVKLLQPRNVERPPTTVIRPLQRPPAHPPGGHRPGRRPPVRGRTERPLG